MSTPDASARRDRSERYTLPPTGARSHPGLHVLVCDGEASTRFAVKRLVVQELACTVTECSNGVEVLEVLGNRRVDLLILDIEMARLNGIDVLGEIRASPACRSVPVLILSKERRQEPVQKLLELGIDGYLLKPLRGEALRASLDRLMPRLETGMPPDLVAGSARVRGPQAGVLLVDGDPAFRTFFGREGRIAGPVSVAGSGTEALAIFRQAAFATVFVGSALGILSPAVFVQRLRALAGDRRVFVVSIGPEDAAADPAPNGFDLLMAKTLDPERLRAEMRRVLAIPTPIVEPHAVATEHQAAIPGLRVSQTQPQMNPIPVDDVPQSAEVHTPLEVTANFAPEPDPTFDATALADAVAPALIEAAAHVFTLIVDAALEPHDRMRQDHQTSVATAFVDMSLLNRGLVVLGFRTDEASMNVIAARMLGSEPGDVTEGDRASTAQELVRLIGGHILQCLDEAGMTDCTAPRTEERVAGRGAPRHHQVFAFRAQALEAEVELSLAFHPLGEAFADVRRRSLVPLESIDPSS